MVAISDVRLYASEGLRVFPLVAYNDPKHTAKERGKLPKVKRWPAAPIQAANTIDPLTYENAEFGWALNRSHLVIDVDPRNFKEGHDPLAELGERLGLNFNTILTTKVRTGGGGLHLYFKKPSTYARKFKTHKDFQGIDFLTFGNFVVGVGSKHGGATDPLTYGVPYTFTEDSLPLSQMADCPTALLNFISAQKEVEAALTGHRPPPPQEPSNDTPYNLSLAISSLDLHPPAISGQNGNDNTFKAAAIIRDFGISKKAAFDVMMQYYNPRCVPPWSENEIKTFIRNAYSYGKNKAGARAPENSFTPVAAAPTTTAQTLDLYPEKASAPTTPTASPSTTDQSTAQLYNWRDELQRTSTGIIKASSLKNTLIFMRNDPQLDQLLVFNEFTQQTHFTRPAPWHKPLPHAFPPDGIPWMDQDGPSLKLYLANIGYDCEVRILEESVTCMAHANPHHPVRNYLRSLEWDGKRRVEDWLHTYCGVTSNAYTQMVGLKTLIAAVARVMEVGCKFDYMLILEGPQGTGKSSVVSALAGRWFTDSMPMDLSSKDAPEYMRGKWIIEMAELACTTKAETSTLKAFLSRSTDRARMAYARHAKDFPRQCIFIGTTNEQTYLKDETGNRRFWPVKTGKMNVAKLREDRDQIWAEALLLYETCDVKLYLEGEQVATMAKVEQQGRQLLDEWCEELATYIQRDPEIRKTGYVRSAYLWVNCFGRPVGAFDRLSQRRISDAMAVIGWRRQSIRDAEKNVVMAYVPPDNWDWTLRGKEAVLMKEAANILDL